MWRNGNEPKEVMLDLIGSGMSVDEILEDYPDLEKEELLACILFAKKAISEESIHD